MSGICGIVLLDGRPVVAADLDAMIQPLRRRGPDGRGSWAGAQVSLGFTRLATTPEAAVESLPLIDAESGCAITADARLDNRDALARALGRGRPGSAVGDGQLILWSYLKWGSRCVDHLLGDFAFAIWDPRQQALFCARDHIGMRQLHYAHLPGRLFLFATEPTAVLAHPFAPRELNEGRIADFLGNLESLDLSQTFFRGISRLPPAHTLTLTRRGLTCDPYWQPAREPELKLRSDRDYAEAFLDVFREAVRCRLRSNGPIGSMLSGGVDSTAVSAVAAQELAAQGLGPLHTISAIGPDPESCIETRTARAAMAIPGIVPLEVNHENLDAYLDDLVQLTATEDEPFEGWMALLRAVYLAANRAGIKIVLDGVGADLTIAAGWTIAHHFRSGRIIRAVQESIAEARFAGSGWPASRSFLSGAWRAFAPPALRELKHRYTSRFKDPVWVGGTPISEEFAHGIDFSGRRRQWREEMRAVDSLGRYRSGHWSVHPLLVVARERYDRLASALAIEPRDPFSDVRVLQFGLRLPAEQRQRDGWPKLILRNAMEGLVPNAVRWRRGKEHLGRSFATPVFERLGQGEDLLSRNGTIARYVDLAKWSEARLADASARDLAKWQDVVYLALWLNSVAGMLGGRGAARKES
jgi:asparagine synthase (glutamine-hydrolysing)